MEETKTPAAPRLRYPLLDELRGLAFLSMAVYHGMWDLVFLCGVQAGWYTGTPGVVWQFVGCAVFILLSGYCVPLGRHTFRRGLEVFGAGALVTLVTWLFLPEELVLFGVLTMLGSVMLLTALARPALEKIPGWAGLAVCLALFALCYNINAGWVGLGSLRLYLPGGLYRNLFTTYLGFPCWYYYSTDYYSLIPWLFLYWAGYFLHRVKAPAALPILRRSVCRPLGWIGRHSLILYLVHQPVLYGIFYLYFTILR